MCRPTTTHILSHTESIFSATTAYTLLHLLISTASMLHSSLQLARPKEPLLLALTRWLLLSCCPRTLPRFKCRNLYDPIQIQECLKFFVGWMSAKDNCPAVPKLFDRFENVNNSTVTSYYSWTYYDWNSQPYSDFCWNLQGGLQRFQKPRDQ